jgi:predicted phosphohydrolase
MRLFALSDPHLSFSSDKPMDVFGPGWHDHVNRLTANWTKAVAADDVVLIAGDISWATKLEDAVADLRYLANLPGQKILLRGNHDYWWSTVAKMEKVLAKEKIESLTFMRYKALQVMPRVFLAGSRGWELPTESQDPEEAESLYRRELLRFELAFSDAKARMQEGDLLIAVSHYPPLGKAKVKTPLSDLIKESGATLCLHGHVHTEGPLIHELDGVQYVNTASDQLQFTPLLIFDGETLRI